MRTTAIAALLSSALCATASRILVILDTNAPQANFRGLWSSLEERHHSLTFRSADATSPALYEHDAPAFDHVFFFAPSVKTFGEDLSPQRLVSFLNDGGNLLVAGSAKLSEYWREFAREFDVDYDVAGTSVIDHFNRQHSDSSSLITVPANFSPDRTVVTAPVRSGAPILYRGTAHRLGRNPLAFSILTASSTSISSEDASTPDALEQEPLSGQDIQLVSAVQTRGNSRVVFTGSVDIFSDELAEMEVSHDGHKSRSGNAAFVGDVTRWVLQESGVLRVVSSRHTSETGEVNPKQYRVRDPITFEMEIQSLVNGNWSPLPLTDVQLDFTMLDPHVRTYLKPSANQLRSDVTLLQASFNAPDRHGVFSFKVDYRRPGWSYLRETLQVAVTPLRHDQYPRFIGGATPYYLGASSVAASFGVFSFAWLLHNPARSA